MESMMSTQELLDMIREEDMFIAADAYDEIKQAEREYYAELCAS